MRLEDLGDRLNARLSALNNSIDDRINRLNEKISTFGEFAVDQKKTITVEILCDTNEKYTIHIWAIDECDKVEIGILNEFYMAYSKYYKGNQDDIFKIFKNARSELKTPIGSELTLTKEQIKIMLREHKLTSLDYILDNGQWKRLATTQIWRDFNFGG